MEDPTPRTLSTLRRTNTYDSRRAELSWGEHVVGHLWFCERWGHPYCGVTSEDDGKMQGAVGCLECGKEKTAEVALRMAEEARKAKQNLFEDKFLEAMKRK